MDFSAIVANAGESLRNMESGMAISATFKACDVLRWLFLIDIVAR